ncbi:peptide/nickel transport system substrate-binding protein [Deinobacterium chartae]|uniref:Peptide/nickel transport system substrate-binding protein n=1 Tax=Deinobacterium chartae TaxID=521158 RepID=A0A841I0Y8_9DEIO|nr:ABC transporter substrate-binding protein [Deinobacterium chartae]MBB6098100.1 peptide/nickel transport system substrate-binding protein [Deinobacterium chartae]
MRARIGRRAVHKGTVALILAVTAAGPAAYFDTATAQAATPQRGGVLDIPLATQPGSFNPVLPAELAATIVNWTMFSPLTAVNPYTLKLEPYLAERYTVSKDLTQWTFFLRRNARWHDGKPVTAEDVKFTFDRIRDPEEGATNLPDFRKVKDVRVINPYQVRVTLNAPDAFFDDRLALGGSEILPKHILGEFKRLKDATAFNTRTPIGNGAFRMKRAVPGQFFELEANPNFFLGRPHLDGITFKIVPDGNTRVTQLLTGQLDWVDIEPTQLNAVRGRGNVKVTTFDSLGYQIFAWNLRLPMFQDLRVREAMMHAVDRKKMAQTVSPGLGYVDDLYVPKGLEWVPRPSVKFREYDPARAKALLAEAGWKPNKDGILEKDGKPFEFKILVDKGDVQREQMGLILQQYFSALGMKVSYDLAERGGRWLEETNKGTFQTRLAAFPIPNIDWVQRLYLSVGQNNGQAYRSARVDNLLNRLLATPERAEQANIMRQVQQALYDDPPNMVLLFRERMTASNAKLMNVPPYNIKDAMPYAFRLWMSK